MTVVVLGIGALDSELVDPEAHPKLTLTAHWLIEMIGSVLNVRATVEAELRGDHLYDCEERSFSEAGNTEVKDQLEDRGYI